MKKKVLICTLVFTLIISILVSCGAKANDMAVRDEMFTSGMMPETETAYGYDGGYYVADDVYNKHVEMEKPIESGSSTGANNGDYREKIIKNVSMSAQTKEYEKALDGIYKLW